MEKIIEVRKKSEEGIKIKAKQLTWKQLWSIYDNFEEKDEVDLIFIMSDMQIPSEIVELSTGMSVDEILDYEDEEAQKIVDAVCVVHKNFLSKKKKAQEAMEEKARQIMEITDRLKESQKR